MFSKKNNKKKNGNLPGILGFIVSFALLLAIFNQTGIIGLLLIGGASFLIASIIRIMSQGLDTSKNEKKSSNNFTTPTIDTGNKKTDELLYSIKDYIKVLHDENKEIEDLEVRNSLGNIELSLEKMFELIKEKPDKASKMRRFMDYYLPTTQKIVHRYNEICNSELESKKITEAKVKIENALEVINNACKKQISVLYSDDVLDVTTDIDALEQMLQRDGLASSSKHQSMHDFRESLNNDNNIKETVENSYSDSIEKTSSSFEENEANATATLSDSNKDIKNIKLHF